MESIFNRKTYRLALETGIGGGSISLFGEGRLVDFSSTDFSELKADNLVENISILLNRRNIKKSELEEIYFSENPGSQTGLKIGAAVARGLSLSLNIGFAGKDLFECILKMIGKQKTRELLIILPVNRKLSVWKHFNQAGVCKNSGRDSSDQIIKNVLDENKNSGRKIYTSIDLIAEPLRRQLASANNVVDLGMNFSFYIGI